MNQRLVLTICLCVVVTATMAQRSVESANDKWLFQYVEATKGVYPTKGTPKFAYGDFDDSAFKPISVPHTWQTYETTKELHPYIATPHPRNGAKWWDGVGIYRKHFTPDITLIGKKIFIEFDGVMKNMLLYVNGKLAGEHLGGYGAFYFDLTSWLTIGKENTIAVVVSNQQVDGHAVAPMDAGCWNFYGGIYRNVRFVVTDRLFIPFQGSFKHDGGTFITSDNVSEASAEVRIRTWVRNEYDTPQNARLMTQLIDKKGNVVSVLTSSIVIYPQQTECLTQTTQVQNPQLWSPSEPNLYKAISQVYCQDKLSDTFETVFGIRDFVWDRSSQKLYVNGNHVNIQGFNRHQEYPWLGDALPYFIHKMDLEDMKYNLNATAIRPGQYCSGQEVFALADSLGLITFAEQPNVKNRPFSPETQWMQVVEMVRKLRNNPSVLLWDMGDETDRAADSQWAFAEAPKTYITCRHCEGSGGNFISITPNELKMSKMLRCSVRGWYGDDDKNLRPDNQQWVGNDEYRHEIALQGKPKESINDRIDQPNLMVWLYHDHGCDRKYRNAPLQFYNPKGWVDSYRIPKYSYYLWQANYASKPMVYVMPHNWRKEYIGQKRNFTVDSNCDYVELTASGKSYGRKATTEKNLRSVTFEDVVVGKGELKVVGYKDNKKSAEMTLPICSESNRLTLKTSHKTIDASLGSVAIITADIVDAKGNHIYGARNSVKWSVEGPATLVGAEEYKSDFDEDNQTRGTLYIDMPVANIIRSTGQPGKIKLTITAQGLTPATIVIDAVELPAKRGLFH